MKLTLRNLGRIQAAELDLRPLTVFVGKNNTNKSWAAYAAYLGFVARSFHEWLGTRRAQAAAQRWMRHFAGALMEGVHGLKDGESVSKTYDQQFKEPVIPVRSDGVLAEIVGIGLPGLLDLVGALSVAPDDTPVLVTSAEFRVSRSGITFDLDVALQHRDGRLQRHRVTGLDKFRLQKSIIQHLHAASCHFLRTYFLPTERALLLQDVVSDITRDRFPLPVRDCDEWMREARQRHASGKRLGVDSELSALLQRAVGGGYAVDANQRMTFEGPGFSVPIASAASMARSLAGLSLYLDNLASPGDVLVIDEPEMNAHPEAQLAIVELFAAMVNRGYHVLFTTHSPYIVDAPGYNPFGSSFQPNNDYAVIHLRTPIVGSSDTMGLSSVSPNTWDNFYTRSVGYPGFRTGETGPGGAPNCNSNVDVTPTNLVVSTGQSTPYTAIRNADPLTVFQGARQYTSTRFELDWSNNRLKTKLDGAAGQSGAAFFYCPSSEDCNQTPFIIGLWTHWSSVPGRHIGPRVERFKQFVIDNEP